MSTATVALPFTKLFFTVSEFARMTALSERTVYFLCERREIDSVRFGSSIRIPRRELSRFLGEPISKG